MIAMIGTGYWGKNLARNLHNLGVLSLICDKNEQTLVVFRQQYPDVETCLAISDVLARDNIKGVVIATPAETHYALAREAIQAGKHVFVEKPLALHADEARVLDELARDVGVTLMVGHLLQYHPVFVRLKEAVLGGELGRVDYIYSNRLNLGKIRHEENILWSFAPHDISMILTLAGGEPSRVTATGGNYLHAAIADVTVTHLDFPSGLKAHVFVSWLHPFKEQKLVVVGERKMAVFDDTRLWADKLLFYPHEIHWENNVPVPAKAEPERVDVPEDEPLALECKHFLDCVLGRREPLTNGREGLEVLRVLNAGQRSLDLGGQPVNLGPEETASDAPFVHETAVVDKGVEIGPDVKVWHFSHVLSGSHVGARTNVGQNVVIGPEVTIGSGCKIQNNVSVYKGVTLEDDVFCGPSMVFTNVMNPRAHINRHNEFRPTLVRKGATIGANSTIVCGHVVGRYAFVGAGSVVTRDVPDHALVVGNPAKRIGWMCACGVRLGEDFTCPHCSKTYRETPQGLTETVS